MHGKWTNDIALRQLACDCEVVTPPFTEGDASDVVRSSSLLPPVAPARKTIHVLGQAYSVLRAHDSSARS